MHGGDGEPTTLVSGVLAFVDRRRNPLVAALPRTIHVHGEDGAAVPWSATTLRYLADEAEFGCRAREPSPQDRRTSCSYRL